MDSTDDLKLEPADSGSGKGQPDRGGLQGNGDRPAFSTPTATLSLVTPHLISIPWGGGQLDRETRKKFSCYTWGGGTAYRNAASPSPDTHRPIKSSKISCRSLLAKTKKGALPFATPHPLPGEWMMRFRSPSKKPGKTTIANQRRHPGDRTCHHKALHVGKPGGWYQAEVISDWTSHLDQIALACPTLLQGCSPASLFSARGDFN